MHKFTMFITAVCVSEFLINFSDSSLQYEKTKIGNISTFF